MADAIPHPFAHLLHGGGPLRKMPAQNIVTIEEATTVCRPQRDPAKPNPEGPDNSDGYTDDVWQCPGEYVVFPVTNAMTLADLQRMFPDQIHSDVVVGHQLSAGWYLLRVEQIECTSGIPLTNYDEERDEGTMDQVPEVLLTTYALLLFRTLRKRMLLKEGTRVWSWADYVDERDTPEEIEIGWNRKKVRICKAGSLQPGTIAGTVIR